MTTATTWEKYLNSSRRKPKQESGEKSQYEDNRTEFEKDQDRISFSTPLRRLADKTQVFPLEKNDSIRTRLTHSLEVANIAWNFGVRVSTEPNVQKLVGRAELIREIPPILRASALMHDFGNPPFGHQGEEAIRSWFKKNDKVLKNIAPEKSGDFLNFEGNAQGFRLITKLQLINDVYGLDLTYATLATFLKYPFSSEGDKKKYGYFFSEKDIATEVLEKTGLEIGTKHPLNCLMEASDDIAYSTMDVEDAVKKQIVSFHDLVAFLEKSKSDPVVNSVVEFAKKKTVEYTEKGLHSKELSIVLMERMRAHLIYVMAGAVGSKFIEKFEGISKKEKFDLFDLSGTSILKEQLTAFAKEHAYRHHTVLAQELHGRTVVHSLMDMLWIGISAIDKDVAKEWKKRQASENFVISHISKNYLRVYENAVSTDPENKEYYKLRLLTDMVSGMTDTFAVNLEGELQAYLKGHTN